MTAATKSAKMRARRPAKESVPPPETKPVQAALFRIAPSVELEPSPTSVIRIVPGVMALFALLIGANYWLSERGRASDTAQVVRPISTSAQSPVVAEQPTDRPAPQLSDGVGPLNSEAEPEKVTASIAEQSPVSASVQPPQPALEHEPRYITVAEGQSLLRIARANHLSAKAIAAANHLEPPYLLTAGSQLLIPDPSPPSD
jgi:LysM repeat protein